MVEGGDWLETLWDEIESGPGVGSTLLVGVSGGGDSVALLHGLVSLRERLDLRLVVAHLDHAIRPDSGADAAFVGQLALSLGVQCLRERREVAALAAQEGTNLEEIARQVRYEMLEEAALAVNAAVIVLAHTADDQAETVLMHLLRGAGLDGLKGMLRLAPSPLPGGVTPLFRPLLGVPRARLRAWLRERDLDWREDSTNEDTTRFRSRLRHKIIPLLEKEQPALRQHLGRTARLLADEYLWLEAETEAAWQRLATVHNDAVRFARDHFLTLPTALQRRLLRRAFFSLRPGSRDLSFEQVEHALEIAARGESGARATLPGHLFLIVEANDLWIGERPEYRRIPTLTTPVTLPDEGTVHVGEWRVTISRTGRAGLPERWEEHPATTAFLDLDAVKRPLSLRPPEPGDRWTPLGMAEHSVDLHDWLAKRKVPRSVRGMVPLLVDASGAILWVVGWDIAHPARVRPSSERLLRLKVEQ